jgi:hypothetical protein
MRETLRNRNYRRLPNTRRTARGNTCGVLQPSCVVCLVKDRPHDRTLMALPLIAKGTIIC